MVRGCTAILMLALSSIAFAGTGGMQNSQAPQSSAPNSPPSAKAGVNEDTKGVDAGASHATTDKAKRVLKIGVTQITSSNGLGLSVDGLQQELFNNINFLGAKAVIISSNPNDRDASNEEAKQQGCDYVIFTNVTGFKTASVGQKLGSVLGRGGLGGVGGTAHGRVEISADVKVFQPDNFTPVVDGNNVFRGNDAENTAKGLMHTEARTVMLQIKNLQSPKKTD